MSIRFFVLQDYLTLIFHLEKGHCMTETGQYSHNKKTTLTVVWLFILFYLRLLNIISSHSKSNILSVSKYLLSSLSHRKELLHTVELVYNQSK